MANKKITELTEETSPVGADLLPLVDDVAGTPTTKKVTVTNLMTLAPVQTADISGFATQVSLGNHASLTSSVHGISAFGATLVDDADAATARTTLGLGTAATSASTDFSPAFYSTVTESTTARTLSDSDNGKIIVCSNSSDVTISVPDGLTSGFNCILVQSGTGKVTAVASGTAIVSGYNAGSGVLNSTVGQYASIEILPVGSDSYIVSGEAGTAPYINTYSLSFDGSNDYVGIPVPLTNSLSALTISAWINPQASLSDFIFGNRSSGGLAGYVSNSSTSVFIISGSQSVTCSQTFSQNTWYHWAFVFDGSQSASADKAKIYVNGTNLSQSSNNVTSTSMANSTNNMRIGDDALNVPGFTGLIDEFAVFNTALSSSDIQTISSTPDDLSTYNPIGWWRMGDDDGGTGTTITDQGSGGNDGTLNNFVSPNGFVTNTP